MKISKLINQLEKLLQVYGDIPCKLSIDTQSNILKATADDEGIATKDVETVAQSYNDDATVCEYIKFI